MWSLLCELEDIYNICNLNQSYQDCHQDIYCSQREWRIGNLLVWRVRILCITSFNFVGPMNITLGWWELILNMNLYTQLFDHSTYLLQGSTKWELNDRAMLCELEDIYNICNLNQSHQHCHQDIYFYFYFIATNFQKINFLNYLWEN